ncbi:conserved hypothetical protein [Ancylobacter novellus DSM 506]|uniref:Uncharacterized protein n=1 Tax=Ancylobacter novellus (strain ATCC 8093 / DSM 506 / JCM 20403 / CCM 1077 / IAM 12100 / NBRC 12443 / NCIMB 10456) TaxID=639283 RepID=D7A3Y8_ANCN5|nr:hypothetical protein [Ancylobacter novellus]ADH91765.1 conserved hypothetical protein [Ancylobacter novellus DSM 506]
MSALAASFKMVIRCHNCRKDVVQRLDVPAAEDAPTCVDELVESGALSQLRFHCPRCEGMIGSVRAVSEVSAQMA